MTEKRFRIESERIGNTYSIHIFKDDEVIFEISNWESLSNIHKKECEEFVDYLNSITDKNEQLKSENKRLTDKLNKTALELVGECISQGKATEISEMSYKEFLDYRAKNGKPMELQK